MEIGTMEIVGKINVESIKMGLNQMKNSLEGAKVQAKSLFGDMERLGKSVSGIGKTLAIGGVGFLGSLTAIASVGPQTTIAMERMKFEMFRLGMALDDVLGPAFNNAVDYVGDFVDYLGGDGKWMLDTFGEVVRGVGKGVVDFAIIVKSAVEGMKELAKDWSASLGINFEIKTIGEIAEHLGPAVIAGFITKHFAKFLGAGKAAGPLGMVAMGTTLAVTGATTPEKEKSIGDRLSTIGGAGMAGLGAKALLGLTRLAGFAGPVGWGITAAGVGWEGGSYLGGKATEATGDSGVMRELSNINVGIWNMIEELTKIDFSGRRESS